MNYDEKLEVEIEKARTNGDYKQVFVLGLELENWRGYKL